MPIGTSDSICCFVTCLHAQTTSGRDVVKANCICVRQQAGICVRQEAGIQIYLEVESC